jgi:NADH dehydrogenase/NADH:ubiquinone oxidoreductase subunit G
MVNLTIDGKQVTVSKAATIYEAAKEAGIHIHRLVKVWS